MGRPTRDYKWRRDKADLKHVSNGKYQSLKYSNSFKNTEKISGLIQFCVDKLGIQIGTSSELLFQAKA